MTVDFKRVPNTAANGTVFQGTLNITHDILVARFGEPDDSPDLGKTNVSWTLRFSDGTIATIYDWYTGLTALGASTRPIPEDVTLWNIGGNSKLAVAYVANALHEGDTKYVLGHTFRPMSREDWAGMSNADEGSLICYLEHTTLILAPNGVVHEISDEGDQTNWTPTKIN